MPTRDQLAVTGLLGCGLLLVYRSWAHRRDGVVAGYIEGRPNPLTVVTIDGQPVEASTAAAFRAMKAAAARTASD